MSRVWSNGTSMTSKQTAPCLIDRRDLTATTPNKRNLIWLLNWHYYSLRDEPEMAASWDDVLRLTRAVWDEVRQDIGLCKIGDGEYERWCTTTCRTSTITDLLKALDTVKQALLTSVEKDDPYLLYYSTLKAELRASGISAITVSLLKPVMAAAVETWSTSMFSTVFRGLYQCCSFPLRWNPFLFERDRTKGNRPSAIACASLGNSRNDYEKHSYEYNEFVFDNFVKYVENNDRLAAVQPPSRFIAEWFRDYLGEWLEYSNCPIPSEYFRFSGGATREFKRGTHELEKALYVAQHRDPFLLQAIEDLTGDDWTLLTPFSCVMPASVPYDVSTQSAQLALVPKSYKAFRIITNEPTELVLYQQGLARSWREYYASHSELSGRYTAERGPEIQRRKALDASIHGRYATVDLSSASDSVSMTFFRGAFALLPRTQRYLEIGRTKCVDPPSELKGLTSPVTLNMFAGMGNPLTFNLEVAVFLAIGAEAIHLCGDDFRHSILSVVGDDIIIETKYYDVLVELLTRYGFIVNSDKSYSGAGIHRFRESCGTHALDGCDVTPAFLPRNLSLWSKSTKQDVKRKRMSTIWPVQAISVANDLAVKGLRRARAEVIHIMCERLDPIFYPPFCSFYEEGGIKSLCPTNFHLQTVDEEFVRNSPRFRRIWLNDSNTKYCRYGRLAVSYDSIWDTIQARMVPSNSHNSKVRVPGHLRLIKPRWGFAPFELYWILRRGEDPGKRWLAAIGISTNTQTETLLSSAETDNGPYPFTGGPRLWWEATIGAFTR